MKPLTDAERIAVLEAEAKTTKERLGLIIDKLDTVEKELTRYKGFLGGITFIMSGIVVAVGLVKDWFLKQ